MQLVTRVRNIILKPVQEWAVIARESTGRTQLMERYVAPLAAIGPICSFLASLFLWHRSLLVTCILAILAFLLEFPYVLVVASIADSFASTWGVRQNPDEAVKLVASCTRSSS